MRWFGDVQQRDSELVGRQMRKMELPGSRQRGRTQRRFMDVVRVYADSWCERRGCRGQGKMKKGGLLW